MLEIVEGSLIEAKEEMKKTIALLKQEDSKLKKSVKLKDRTSKQKETLKKHEAFAHFFRVSQMQPVFVESICINYILYSRYMKKLKGLSYEEKIEDGKLIISYWNPSIRGVLTLYDITDKLEGLNFFPRAVIK